MAHNFHPHCGCYSCGLQEEAGERDDELRVTYLTALTACPDFIAEVPMNGEECTAAAAAINTGDMAELGRIFLRAAEREASERIEIKSDECGITQGEAAERLVAIYRTDPMMAVDTGELLADQIIRGNADLVQAQHQTMEVGHE